MGKLLVIKSNAVLGSRKPLLLSQSVLGGYKKLVGVGVFIPTADNQFASSKFKPVFKPIFKANLVADSTFRPEQSAVPRTMSATATQNNDSLPFFAENNGFLVKMQINSKQDNPLSYQFYPQFSACMDLYSPTELEYEEVVTGETPEQQAEREARNEQKALLLAKQKESAIFFNTEDTNRLIPLDYDIKPQTKIDFIVDVNEGNKVNYTDKNIDIKIYLKFR